MFEFRGQELTNLIPVDAQPPLLQHLLLNIPVDPPTFPLRAAWLRHQCVLGSALAEPVVILEEGLPVGLMKSVEIGDKPELGIPFLFDQLVLLDQEFPLADIIAIQGLSWVLCRMASPPGERMSHPSFCQRITEHLQSPPFLLSSPIPDYKRRGQALIGDPASLPFSVILDICHRGSRVFALFFVAPPSHGA